MIKKTDRILKLADIAELTKADQIQILKEICIKGEPAYISCPPVTAHLTAYALQREKSHKPWLPKQQLLRSHSREITFFSDDTTSRSSVKIPPDTLLEIPDQQLKLLTVRDKIEVSRFSGTRTINIDDQLKQEVVTRSPRSYFTPRKSNELYPQQKKNSTPLLMEHYIVTTKCDSNFESFCIEAAATISIGDVWVHEDAVTTAVNAIQTRRRKSHPWRTHALGILIEAAEKFFKGRPPTLPTTPEECTKIEDHLHSRVRDFTDKQIKDLRILITPENFHREGSSNMQKWNINREGIEDHISISLHYMISIAKNLNKQNLQSSGKHIQEELEKIGPSHSKVFSDKKAHAAKRAIKLRQ